MMARVDWWLFRIGGIAIAVGLPLITFLILMENQMTDERIAASITRGHCPVCDYRGFILGPRGGAAQNIECGNLKCRARFNVTMFAGVCVHAEPIPRESEGGSRWGMDSSQHEGARTLAPIGWP